MQWGGAHVWKIGGKVFALGSVNKLGQPAYSFKVSDLHFELLKDEPGYRGAPYMASRGMKWIQADADVPSEALNYYLSESFRLVSLGLTKTLQKTLGLNQ